jgi:hypothetical protein
MTGHRRVVNVGSVVEVLSLGSVDAVDRRFAGLIAVGDLPAGRLPSVC